MTHFVRPIVWNIKLCLPEMLGSLGVVGLEPEVLTREVLQSVNNSKINGNKDRLCRLGKIEPPPPRPKKKKKKKKKNPPYKWTFSNLNFF